VDEKFRARWAPCVTESFTVAALPSAGEPATGVRQWRVDLAAGIIRPQASPDGDDSDWDIVGSVEAWQAVLNGRVNLGVALRHCDLRYCDDEAARQTGPAAADVRIAMLTELIGLGSAPVAVT
jgi:hypothetical protein